ncbi:hypothetical protein EA473_16230 [Natrarchaeobius chitinivorans]|uniref:Uncharacterized protein n=1 Tax=Natrarchaeobius chitinivorans TaxID=1679083 RepID=A0A3N6P8S4_NATCH|nr:hypothetical protein EA473_16230 [Natrarchaeobius chitinivorans]
MTAFGTVLWLSSPETTGVVVPLERIGWLLAFAVVVQGVLWGVTFLAGLSGTGTLGLVALILFVVVPVSIALFLTPGFIVLGGTRPIEATLESLEYALANPSSTTILVVGLGYIGYALTGLGSLVSSTPLGLVVGTVASVTVAGTLDATIVATTYRRWTDQAR